MKKLIRSLGFFIIALLFAATTVAHAQTANAAIPSRPEQLKFPPLKYEPPDPADYRTVLKNGAVAYVVPDHELPLINIRILVRTPVITSCRRVKKDSRR